MFWPRDILAVMVKARGNIGQCDQSDFYTGGQMKLFNMIGCYVT